MFKRFATKTSIHGFSEISEINSTFWKQVWSVLVITAFGLTAFQIYRGIDQYINQEPVINVAPAKPEEILYPPFMICSPHWMYWVDWKKAYSLNFTKPIILYALSFTFDIESHISFDITEARQELVQKMSASNISRLLQFYEIIARPFPMKLYSQKYDNFTILNSNAIDIVRVRKKLLLCYKIQSEEVSKHVPDFQLHIYDLSYSYASEGLSEIEYKYNIIQILNLFGLLSVPLDNGGETNKNFTSAGLPWIFFPANYELYMEIGADRAWYMGYVYLSAQRTHNVKSKPCDKGLRWDTENETMEEEKCIAMYHLKTCRCPEITYAILIGEDTIENVCPKEIRFIFVENNERKTNSSIETMQSCAENETAQLDLNKCLEDVSIPCEIWTYSYVQSESQLNPTLLSLVEKNQTVLILCYPEPSSILISTEINVQTWETFIGNIGGVLGIWTGASVLSFFQLFYLLCTSVHGRQHKMQK